MENPTRLSAIKKMPQIKVSVIPNINLALQQNACPVITDIELQNISNQDYTNIELSVNSSPDFLIERTWPIEKLSSDDQLIIEDCRVELNADYLRAIKEAIKGELRFTLGNPQ